MTTRIELGLGEWTLFALDDPETHAPMIVVRRMLDVCMDASAPPGTARPVPLKYEPCPNDVCLVVLSPSGSGVLKHFVDRVHSAMERAPQLKV